MSYEDLEPTAARDLLDQEPDLVVLDVRTAPEFVRHRIAGAVLIPVQELAMRTAELDPARRHLVVCEHGVRSVAACFGICLWLQTASTSLGWQVDEEELS